MTEYVLFAGPFVFSGSLNWRSWGFGIAANFYSVEIGVAAAFGPLFFSVEYTR
jgi:hypothetical protein